MDHDQGSPCFVPGTATSGIMDPGGTRMHTVCAQVDDVRSRLVFCACAGSPAADHFRWSSCSITVMNNLMRTSACLDNSGPNQLVCACVCVLV
jgi:hypothetical protein